MTGQRFANEAEAAHIQLAVRGTAVLQEACIAERCHQMTAGCVRVRMVNMSQMRSCPDLQFFSETPVLFFEERPVEERFIRHQSPSNTGFSFFTKAS